MRATVQLMFLSQTLLVFLKRVVDNEANKMTMNNVSMIMAPNLFLVAGGACVCWCACT